MAQSQSAWGFPASKNIHLQLLTMILISNTFRLGSLDAYLTSDLPTHTAAR